jgi:hypothetical protein
MANYPYNLVSQLTNETSKIENLPRTNLFLMHPLELDDDDLVQLKMEHASFLIDLAW